MRTIQIYSSKINKIKAFEMAATTVGELKMEFAQNYPVDANAFTQDGELFKNMALTIPGNSDALSMDSEYLSSGNFTLYITPTNPKSGN